MLNREKYEQYIVGQMGPTEKPQAISPGTLDLAGQIPVQGYVALTQEHLVFLQESALGEIQIQTFDRKQLAYHGTTYGLTGKTYLFVTGGSEVKISGVELPFEQIIEKNFNLTHAPTSQVQGPSASMPPPSASMPSPTDSMPPPTASMPPPTASMPPPKPAMSIHPPPLPPTRPPLQSDGPASFRPTPAPDDLPQYMPSSGSRGPMLAVFIMMGVIFLLGVVVYFLLSSQSSKTTISEPATQTTPAEDDAATAPTSDTGAPKASLIVMLNPSGKEMINIRKKESGAYNVLVEGTTYKGKVEQDRIKIKDDAGNTLLKVKVKEGGAFKVTDASDVLIAKIKSDGAGFKVSNDTATLAKIKAKGGGFVVTDGSGGAIGSVEPDGNNWKALDAAGNHLFTVRGSQGRTAALALALKDNSAVQAAVLLYLNEF